jgi:hypothetical protein
MLRPDSVNLVNPPTTKMPNTSAEQPNSHLGKDLGRTRGFETAEDDVAEVASRVAVENERKDGEKKE